MIELPAMVATLADGTVVRVPRMFVGFGRANPFQKWRDMQIWGPCVGSSSCPACLAHIAHTHGFYASTGGE